MNQPPEKTRILSKLVQSWFDLTGDEQRALLLILVLLLLGFTVRCIHLKNEKAGHADRPFATNGNASLRR